MGEQSRAAGNALHMPVMLKECLELLGSAIAKHPAPVMIDATLGMGGHSEAFLQKFPHLNVIGIDRDDEALALAGERLAPFRSRLTLVKATYDRIGAIAKAKASGHVQAILMDLGVSSLQLDEQARGFSYAHDAPLDMRMDATSALTAQEILDTWPQGEIARILKVYGEERFARAIAARIVERRADNPLRSTGDLADVVKATIPAPARRKGGNPAKRTFQALRIAVNNELDVLEKALPAALDALAIGGRIVVESYQSLEDKRVKAAFAQATSSHSPQGLPVELAGYEAHFKPLTRGAMKASASEQASNPRSRSVRLRGVERISEEDTR